VCVCMCSCCFNVKMTAIISQKQITLENTLKQSMVLWSMEVLMGDSLLSLAWFMFSTYSLVSLSISGPIKKKKKM